MVEVAEPAAPGDRLVEHAAPRHLLDVLAEEADRERFGTETSPSSGCSSPVIIRNSVVLPAPFGPTRPTFSPGLSCIEASTKRIWRPYCFEMLVRVIMGRVR